MPNIADIMWKHNSLSTYGTFKNSLNGKTRYRLRKIK